VIELEYSDLDIDAAKALLKARARVKGSVGTPICVEIAGWDSEEAWERAAKDWLRECSEKRRRGESISCR
jgi:hypothetical protein